MEWNLSGMRGKSGEMAKGARLCPRRRWRAGQGLDSASESSSAGGVGKIHFPVISAMDAWHVAGSRPRMEIVEVVETGFGA